VSDYPQVNAALGQIAGMGANEGELEVVKSQYEHEFQALPAWTKRKAIEFDANGLQILNNPGVYIYTKDDRAIYVGSSDCVIGRALAANHHKRKEFKQILNGASLLIFPCDTAKQALELEKIITAELQPILNERNLLPADELAQALGITIHRARQLAKELTCPNIPSE
jgi:predicted GIY-YIG superfamily endonuclease